MMQKTRGRSFLSSFENEDRKDRPRVFIAFFAILYYYRYAGPAVRVPPQID